MNKVFLILLVCVTAGPMTASAGDSLNVANEQEFFSLLQLDLPELTDLREAVAQKDWSAAKTAWGRHLEDALASRWIWSHRDREKIMAYLKAHGKGLEDMPKSAETVLRREFSIQGVSRTLERDMVWSSKEYGYEWGNVLNRHSYWATLGKAWWQAGDAKYVEDWAYMVRDWIKDNPVDKKGPPWRSLEVGIRATEWFDIMSFFMNSPEFDMSLRYDMTRSLVEHARLLYNNNGKFKKGNWQTCECTGLACVGIMLPEFKESKEWRQRAFQMMSKHMEDGVYPDGAQYELTPKYHYWVTKEFLRLLVLAEKNGYELKGLPERHEKMFEFLMNLSKPDRWCMSLGDASSGLQVEEPMALGALLYNRPDMRYLGLSEPAADWVWMLPFKTLESYGGITAKEPELRSHMMPYAKYGLTFRTSQDTFPRIVTCLTSTICLLLLFSESLLFQHSIASAALKLSCGCQSRRPIPRPVPL